jgi:peptide/nickel transport system permease protein
VSSSLPITRAGDDPSVGTVRVRTPLRMFGIPFLRRRYFLGVSLLTLIVVACLVGPLVLGVDPNAQDISQRLQPPAPGAHLFGTDSLGRDVLARLLVGGRISLLIGISAAALAAVVGTLLGLVAGFRERRAGAVIMGFVDAQLAFPFILLAIVFVATLGSSVVVVIAVLALSSWVAFARPLHALTLSLKERDFILAARTLGARDRMILRRHLLPHVLPTAVVIATIQVAHVVLFESALSFLGMGVPPGVPTWGSMLSESRSYLQTAPWLSVLPGLALVLTVFSLSLLGDWLRDLLDPRRARH